MLKKLISKLLNFLWVPVVIVPVAFTAVFHFFLAHDEYEVNASVIIKENKQSQGPALPGVAGALFAFGNNTSVEDAYVLREYLQSESFFAELAEKVDLRGHFSSGGFPFFQALRGDASLSDLTYYMEDRITASVSTETSMVTLSVRSFDPEFSKALADLILAASEERINALSSRITESRMLLATNEFEKAESGFRGAKLKLLDFQKHEGFLDTDSEIGSRFGRMNEIRDRIASSTIELETLKQTMQASAPQVVSIEDQIAVLKKQLLEMELEFLGNEDGSSLSTSSDFSKLSLDVEFELNKYTAALAALQQAQLEASQQQKFLLVVADPLELDSAVYPDPMMAVFTVAVVCFLLFLLIKLIVSSILDHTV